MILKFDLWLSGAVFRIWFGLCANIVNIFIGQRRFDKIGQGLEICQARPRLRIHHVWLSVQRF